MSNLEISRAALPAGGPVDGESRLELLSAREASIGPGQEVMRALPRRARRMVGPWCFLDHFEADRLGRPAALDVPPHPHIGLQTVTWLFSGAVLHRDSLGSMERIRPGQLNLMTSGRGIAHSEESRGDDAVPLRGLQLWTALPEGARNGPASFDHHEDLPRWTVPGADVVLAIGNLAGEASPARVFSPIVGAQIQLRGGEASIPLDPAFEHALFVVSGSMAIGGLSVGSDVLAYLGRGRDGVEIGGSAGTTAFLLGGEPFAEEILMWWNFVARTDAEMEAARGDWQSRSRFGEVRGYPGGRLEAPEYRSR